MVVINRTFILQSLSIPKKYNRSLISLFQEMPYMGNFTDRAGLRYDGKNSGNYVCENNLGRV